ncbi:MAG: TerB family tellurite resistance protein [Deltaproteobacteria bacterium]|nr:TerB family tellurite resistance protein [Deltaproteobacteria bacterium]MBW2256975.1 TerB family tellurite resistance protein [Deltaproteobacteria bacterium]
MAEQDFECLKLAFTYHLSYQVADADGRVDPSEAAFLDAHFPRTRLGACGFLDADGAFTETYRETVEQALRILPQRLGQDEKRSLMEVVRQAVCSAEGRDEREFNVLIVAARFLGLDPAEWTGDCDSPKE